MNKELELEARKYNTIILGNGRETIKQSFIAGASSKYVEKQKVEFAIELLKYVKQMYPCSDKEECVNVKIQELEQKLFELCNTN